MCRPIVGCRPESPAIMTMASTPAPLRNDTWSACSTPSMPASAIRCSSRARSAPPASLKPEAGTAPMRMGAGIGGVEGIAAER